jgi:glycosyltransferase involved in cell wall biosynthesis
MPIRVCFPFVGDSVGGSHIATALLIKHFDPKLVEPLVVVHQPGPLCGYLDQLGVPYTVVPVANFAGAHPSIPHIAWSQARALRRLAGVVRNTGIEIVHTNDLRMHLTWAPAARAGRAKFLWHQHVLLSPSRMWSLLARVANRAICVSEAVRRTMPNSVGVDVVLNPLDLSGSADRQDRKPELVQELALDPNCRLVGYVGNMTQQKRPNMFIRAAAQIAGKSAQPIAFVMFGDDRGGQRANSEQLAKDLGIADQVHFLGHKSPIEQWLAPMEVLLAPGVGDGFGRTLIEGMAVSTPVVAVNSGGHPEIIDDRKTGILVPPDDPDSMATAALEVLNDPDLGKHLASAGLSFATGTFLPARIAAQVAAIYGQMND